MVLFLLEDAQAGDRVAIYTGDVLTAEQAAQSESAYLFRVNRNTILDAADPSHAVGRYINDGPMAGLVANAAFGSGRYAHVCRKTGQPYVSIRATRPIKAGQEIYVSYGRAYWGKGGFDRRGTRAKYAKDSSGRAPPGYAMI